MPPAEIRFWLKSQPFRPFRICVLEKTTIEVRHPEVIALKLATLDVFERKPISFLSDLRKTAAITMRHISRLEYIDGFAPTDGNGSVS